MRVLVTRPVEDAEATAERLIALGHNPLVVPLLRIEFVDGEPLALAGVQALLATSSNGARALARRTNVRNVPLFAVGAQTAETARRAGFEQVHDARGDATGLAALVAGTLDKDAGSLLHATGAEAEGTLAGNLSAAGFAVTRAVLYRTPSVEALPAPIADALKADRLDAVLLFSARSARVFHDCVARAALEERCKRVLLVCISSATAAGLGTMPNAEIRVAAAPNQDALLACLDG